MSLVVFLLQLQAKPMLHYSLAFSFVLCLNR